MKGIVAANTLDEFVSELVVRYIHITPGKNTHNSLGFNSDPLKSHCDISYYGCSFTHGNGVENNQRWTDIIDLEKRYQSNNFGISGCSIDDILSIFVATTKFVKMKKALFLLPDYVRQTIKEQNDQFINIFPNDNTITSQHPWFLLPEFYYSDRAQTAINLISYIANINNIEVYFSSWSPEVFELLPVDKRTKNYHKTDYMGTDKLHPGPAIHRNIANEFMELL